MASLAEAVDTAIREWAREHERTTDDFKLTPENAARTNTARWVDNGWHIRHEFLMAPSHVLPTNRAIETKCYTGRTAVNDE